MPVQTQPKSGVGYFVSAAVDDYVFIGGAMVTDNFGLPLEFRYTEPVRANRLQRILYGDVLERFIHTDVIFANLVERLEQKPGLLIVSDANFISAVKDGTSKGIWLGETRVPKLAKIGDTSETAPNEFLLQTLESSSPIRVRTADSDSSTELRQKLAAQLVELAKTMDLLEPLRRIQSAISLIWDESKENGQLLATADR